MLGHNHCLEGIVLCTFPEVYYLADPLLHSGGLSKFWIFRGIYGLCEQFCLIVSRELGFTYFDLVFISFKMAKTRVGSAKVGHFQLCVCFSCFLWAKCLMFDMDIAEWKVLNRIMYRLHLSMTVGTYRKTDNNNNKFSKICRKLRPESGSFFLA